MTPQESIGHYRIVAKLGEGGMGAVYRATDTKLNRDVAIKMLPPAFAQDSARMQRFEREAQVLASLNHPNIAAIYGVEQGALVMELVEGEELKGPLPLDAALQYARQIAAGLEAAHEKGIVHRDLKPANIKVTPDGTVKLLDFGLAKATEPAAQTGSSQSISPTLSLGMTQAGMLLGTAAYMSPEQARGKTVDRRADIWAFGVVLYEMLTGEQLFAGETVSDTLAHVLTRQPDFGKVPAEVRPLLRRCLERDPKQRLRDLGDAWFLMEAAPAAQAAPRPARQPLPWVLLAAMTLIAGVLGILWWRRDAPEPMVHRYSVEGSRVSMSPDGRWLLMRSNGITVMANNASEWRVLPGTESATYAFWSPDSSTIGYFAGGRLRSISVEGGASRNLAPAANAWGGAWRGGVRDGVILFTSDNRLRTVDLAKGEVRELGVQIPAGQHPELPTFLPEGDGFVFLLEAAGKFTIYRSSLSAPAGPPQRFLDSSHQVTFARHPHSGAWHIFYTQGSGEVDGYDLLTAPVDPRTGESKGPPVKILTDLARLAGTRLVAYDAGDGGMMLWRKASASLPIWRLRWFDRNGNILGTIGDPEHFTAMALSPDETQVATVQGYPATDIWTYDLRRAAGSRFSTEPGVKTSPLWSADGRFLYYVVKNEGGSTIVRRPAGGGQAEVLLSDARALLLQDRTEDGKDLILVTAATAQQGGVFRLKPGSTPAVLETLMPISANESGRTFARVTRDGRWLLLEQFPDSLVFPYPPAGSGPVNTISTGRASFLSPDGKFLYGIVNAPATLFKVSAFPLVPDPAGRGVRTGQPMQLFPIITSTKAGANVGAVSRDGNRILAISADASEELKTQVITDWTSLLPAAR